jgi:hypothetical protein
VGADAPEAYLRIRDETGRLIHEIRGPAREGMNAVEWDLGLEPEPGAPTRRRGVRRIEPGAYTVVVTAGGAVAEGTLVVREEE